MEQENKNVPKEDNNTMNDSQVDEIANQVAQVDLGKVTTSAIKTDDIESKTPIWQWIILAVLIIAIAGVLYWYFFMKNKGIFFINISNNFWTWIWFLRKDFDSALKVEYSSYIQIKPHNPIETNTIRIILFKNSVLILDLVFHIIENSYGQYFYIGIRLEFDSRSGILAIVYTLPKAYIHQNVFNIPVNFNNNHSTVYCGTK